jgi:hypothetical protein
MDGIAREGESAGKILSQRDKLPKAELHFVLGRTAACRWLQLGNNMNHIIKSPPLMSRDAPVM